MKHRLLDRMRWPTLRALGFAGATSPSLSLSLALVLALGLPGCGPGTGGTGSGYPMNSAQAGNAAWTPGTWSSLASSADSTNATTPGSASTGVLLDIAASSIGARAGCWAFTYDGPWGDAASSPLRVTGSYMAPAALGGVATQTADLLIEARDPEVVLTVFDAGGRVLQGPVTLTRSPTGAGASFPSTGCAGQEDARVKG